MSPALAGGFLTTVPPGKSLNFINFYFKGENGLERVGKERDRRKVT